MMEDELEEVVWILICETENCENQNIPIELATPVTLFVCGPCGNQITNARKKDS
jgi:predicted RNA-binding Zn-ribbon protein involved in translation (DUF1610 family)